MLRPALPERGYSEYPVAGLCEAGCDLTRENFLANPPPQPKVTCPRSFPTMTVTLPPRISRLLDLGVPVTMSAFDAKHIRLCNVTSVISGLMALIFFFWEIPLVTDWGNPNLKKEAMIILCLGLSVIPFPLPVWRN